MGKIFCFMGKSSSGKDTIFRIISKDMPNLKKLYLIPQDLFEKEKKKELNIIL